MRRPRPCYRVLIRKGTALRLIGIAVGLGALMAVTMAPATQQPEQITGTEATWDKQAQAFVLQFEVQRSAISPGEQCPNCEITAAVETRVSIREGDVFTIVGRGFDPVVARPGAFQTQGRMVAIAPVRVPWDRNGGTIEGDVTVRVDAKLVWLDEERSPNVENYWVGSFVVEPQVS